MLSTPSKHILAWAVAASTAGLTVSAEDACISRITIARGVDDWGAGSKGDRRIAEKYSVSFAKC